MVSSRFSKRGFGLVLFLGTAFVLAGTARAQEGAARKLAADVLLQQPAKGASAIIDYTVSDALADLYVANFHDEADHLLGATLRPVGEALRAQLGLPSGQGLLVASLKPEGPCAQAGLKQNDVLLTLAAKHLAIADDLTKQLKAAGDAAVPLTVLRAGKPVTIQVRPIYHVTLGPAEGPKKEYQIGVSIDPVDEALRAQLPLPAGQGVLISDVIKGSPAEKAGVVKYDIVLTMADKPIDQPATLAHQVQTTQDKPTTLKILRGGKTVIIPVTAVVKAVDANVSQETLSVWLVDEMNTFNNLSNATMRARLKSRVQAESEDLQQRLDRLDSELKALRDTVEKVNETLKAEKGRKQE